MTTRRPDMLLLAALEQTEVLPDFIVRALLALYDQPSPVNYDTAQELVVDAIGQSLEDLALEELLGGVPATESVDVAIPTPAATPQLAATWESCVPCQSAYLAGGDGTLALAGVVGAELGIGAIAALRVVFHRFHESGHA